VVCYGLFIGVLCLLKLQVFKQQLQPILD
jgi:hypothetical protein